MYEYLGLGFLASQLPLTMAASSAVPPALMSKFNTASFSSPVFSLSEGGKAVCVSGNIPVPVNASNIDILLEAPADTYALTNFFRDLFAVGSTTAQSAIGGPVQIAATYSIFSKLCIPVDATPEPALHFLTHGGTTDYTYWDFAPGYSYVDTAAAKGYATFSYDRLGTGKSQHPDPIKVVQVGVQTVLAHTLIIYLKSAKIGGFKFTSVIGVGHSLGSALTQAVSSSYPSDFSTLLLTGHSAYQGGVPIGLAAQDSTVAHEIPLPQFSGLPNGYVTEASLPQAIQFPFFYYPYFDKAILTKALNTRQTNALGETFTLGFAYVPTTFSGPVLILNGNQDWFYCQGNCDAMNTTQSALDGLFPSRAPSSKAVNLPNTGHNINLHLSAQQAFGILLDFLG